VTVGVPGTGIGGLFYLAAALWLPIRSLFRLGRARANWGVVLRNLALALGVLAGIWATGLLLGWMLAPAIQDSDGGASPVHANVVSWIAFAVGYLTLAVVLGVVQVARCFAARRTS
jgi:hypothetical protein